ncbi:transcriptional repressor general negative regulator of transcription subunit 4 [Kalmusia sp. IMI 367209]|nr:transcriptional repressor general negative regulator of transcription subunit 4 [Kalmusia sp. IMI 367209]
MSRIQQDQFVDDDEEECCPLCVEEFDLSDRNFRPCPCGYQICQFCFNNIKTTMNGLCPACRRPYDESTIEFKNITPEEMAKHKQQIAQKAKKNAQIRQKEAQKAEADSLSRKHLAGLRVVQKNLVYVTGLTPTIREDRLLDTLRGTDYFGQYGKIIKIVVSKARENAQHQQSVGVYVTFARKEDAAACIAAVDGSQNGDRTLRAQYGTTKYCSAYLRGEQCNNRNCMFLHEPGEDNDSFTRQDLSMMNSIQTQQPAQSSTSRSAPPAHHGPPVAAASAPMHRQDSNDAGGSEDIPGLPATANWGSKAAQERRASRSTNASNPSPMTTNAVPAPPVVKPTKIEETPKKKGKEKEKSVQSSKSTTPQPQSQSQPQLQPQPQPASRLQKPRIPGLDGLLKAVTASDFKFVFSSALFSEEELKAITEFPQLLDPNGGAKRRAMREKEKELTAQRDAETQAALQQQTQQQQQAPTENEEHETTAGGSLQLGGEPEETHQPGASHQNQHAIAPPGQQTLGVSLFGQNSSLEDFGNLGLNTTRNLTQQQQQQLLLSNFKSGPQSAGLLSQFQNTQSQQSHAPTGNAPGHTRHTSRFSFANDSASASASVQPVANQKLMNQQSSMMPKNNTTHFNQISQHQPLNGQYYTSGVQGPPPGLKATSTPPVSGGGMFSQGHGFATGGLAYGANATARNNNDALYQDLLRGRNLDGGARVGDAGKRESMFPPFLNQHPTTSTPAPAPGLLSFPYGPSPGAYQDTGSQKSKKKGKKHRHANTSSSGGGVVDVQDPSILQARLHQGGGMVGQGLYGQGQEHPILSVEEEASANVDALVSDAVNDHQGTSTPLISHILDQPRRATPTVPPGFSAPVGLRGIASDQPSRPASRNAVAVPPAVPIIPATPARPATPISKKTKQETPKTEISATKAPVEETLASTTAPTTPAKATQKASLSKTHVTETSKKIAEVPTVVPKDSKAPPPSPTKATPKNKATNKKGQVATELAPQKEIKAPIPATPSSSKRQPPGKLDISAATKIHEHDAQFEASLNKQDAPPKSVHSVSVTTSTSVPASPATISTGSPIKKPIGAKTLRVVATPKTESPPQLPPLSSTALPHVSTVEKLRSRQASIASINQPGTPASELISDTASFTSTSISRANSPPLIGGKVGSALVRKKTKSQAKKERQERARQAEEERAVEEHTHESEIVQAPIVGRKKKNKKPASNPKPPAPPAKIQPEPQKPVHKEDDDTEEQIERKETPPAAVKPAPAVRPSVPSPRPESVADSDMSKERRDPTAQSILADLQKTGELVASTLEFFKPLSSSLAHASRGVQNSGGPVGPPDLKIHFTEADLEALTKKQSVRLTGHDGTSDSRTLITPQGKFFWGLTHELEEKALELEKHIDELKGAARFHPRKHAAQNTASQGQPNLPALATALKEAGAKLSKSTAQEISKLDSPSLPLPPVQASGDLLTPQGVQQPQTPADAGVYLNQFVLPNTDNPPPNAPRPEMAAVGGLPGAGTANISVNANKLAKAAKAVAEGGAVGRELEGIGAITADLLGGVFVQNLEALVGADLGVSSANQDIGLDSHGGLDVQELFSSIQADHPGLFGGFSGRRGRRSVLSVEEAEQAMLAAKKDHEALEKKFSALSKRNRKMVNAGR